MHMEYDNTLKMKWYLVSINASLLNATILSGMEYKEINTRQDM